VTAVGLAGQSKPHLFRQHKLSQPTMSPQLKKNAKGTQQVGNSDILPWSIQTDLIYSAARTGTDTGNLGACPPIEKSSFLEME
jgi:hypothetical protein